MRPIVLASGSPRRRALLEALGLDFEVVTSEIAEHFDGTPEEMVVSNARLKRDDVARRVEAGSVVIAADTLVFLEEAPLGKPASLEEARAMLARLSGRTHHVLTGLSIVDLASGGEAEGFERTAVTFRTLTRNEIDRFVEVVRPTDRAGAYTVDGPGSLLIAAYDGCYQNVLGLPIVRLDTLLRKLDLRLFEVIDAARARFL